MYKVENYKNLLRDPFNQAIVSNDKEKLLDHKSRTRVKEDIQHINQEIASLKNDFQEIKFLLQQIANKG